MDLKAKKVSCCKKRPKKTDHFNLVKDMQKLKMLQKINNIQEKCSANTGTCLTVCLIFKHQKILTFTSWQ